ncbi:hypothetical protein ACLOJK_038370 [Asimina triloba]
MIDRFHLICSKQMGNRWANHGIQGSTHLTIGPIQIWAEAVSHQISVIHPRQQMPPIPSSAAPVMPEQHTRQTGLQLQWLRVQVAHGIQLHKLISGVHPDSIIPAVHSISDLIQ